MTKSSESNSKVSKIIEVGSKSLTIEDVVAVAHDQATVRLNRDPEYIEHIRAGENFINRLLEEDGVVYGVTTGYGDSCTVQVPADLVEDLPLHLSRFHGCGMGAHLSREMTRAVMVTRLNSLAMGYSGVRWRLLERIEFFLNADVLPLIPEEGSVGASGDLTPLSYVAAVLAGEREARVAGEPDALAATEALERAGPNLTVDGFIAAAESITDLDLGIGSPISFGPDRHQGSNQVWGTALDESGTYQTLDLVKGTP